MVKNESDSLDDILAGPGDVNDTSLPEPSAPVEEDLDLPVGVSITQMMTLHTSSGIKWLLGLGDDSRVYNWKVATASWRLFKVVEDESDSSSDPA